MPPQVAAIDLISLYWVFTLLIVSFKGVPVYSALCSMVLDWDSKRMWWNPCVTQDILWHSLSVFEHRYIQAHEIKKKFIIKMWTIVWQSCVTIAIWVSVIICRDFYIWQVPWNKLGWGVIALRRTLFLMYRSKKRI